MEIKSKKKIINYNNEKEAIPIQIQEIKTLYQCNTLKNFNKSKNIQKIIEDGNQYENKNKLQTSLKQNYETNIPKNHKKSLSIRYSANNNTSQKNAYNNSSNKVNNLSNNNSSKNIKNTDNNKFSLSAIKKENEKYIFKNILVEDMPKNLNLNKNKIEKENFMSNLNNIVSDNKKKIKQNQGKINNLINVIKNQDTDKFKRNNDSDNNYEINNGNKTQVFRYIKKIPQKNNDNSTKITDKKNENIKNLKQTKMKKQITNNNNFIINGLNQIYKKSFTIHDEKYNILNKDENRNKNFNKNNIYPNRLFPNTTNLKNSESSNNMRVKIQIKEKKNNKDKKENNIYVNKIKTNNNNLYHNININNNPNIENNNSLKFNKNNNINNINDINLINNNKNLVYIKNNIDLHKKYQVNSPKSVYIPKKATSFRGISQDNSHNKKNMSPICYKNIDTDKYNYNNSKYDNDKYYYYFNSEKRLNNKTSNNYEDNFINTNGRTTYSRKHSVTKQNYNWQNNNSNYDNKIKNNRSYKENNELIKKEGENNINMNELFENDINDISSIKINSSYDSYTMDYESNINRIKFPIGDNDPNNKNEKKNLVYIHKLNNNGGNLNNNTNNGNTRNIKYKSKIDNNIKIQKYTGSSAKKLNDDINRVAILFNNEDKSNKLDYDEQNLINKQNLRYTSNDKKFYDKYMEKFEKNKNQNCFSLTTFSFFKKQNDNSNDYNFNLNRKNINCKSQKNYFNNMNKIEERNIIKDNKRNNKINIKNEILSFRLDDLIILDEKMRDILTSLDNNKPAYYSCFDFLNYFKNNCEIFHNLNLLIEKEDDYIIIKNCINYILISIILLFDYSYKQSLLNKIIFFLKEMINFNYQNLILIYEYLLNNTLLSEIKNIWELKLLQIISTAKSNRENNNSFDNSLSNLDINNNSKENEDKLLTIKNNISFIYQTIKIIIKNYKNKNSHILLYFFKEIHKKLSLKDIFYFFKNKILHSNGLFGYMSPQLVLKQNYNSFNTIKPPYIKSISKKKYTLILGLEETLINFKFGSSNNNGISGTLRFRPGVNYFLSEIKKYYEIIVFSLYPKKIGDYLIDALERKEKYFDYRLFVQHCIVVENEFVKDLKRIGRTLDKIIIVDNLPQNYKLDKKNGINIRSYWEEDYNDVALGELLNILINIAQEGGDVRDGIEKYRNEIIGKVSSKIDL